MLKLYKAPLSVHTTDDGNKIARLSRWIQVQTNYNPSPRNALWDYVMDGSGYFPYQDKFNPDDGLYLSYFRWNGKTYSMDQFLSLGGPWGGGSPVTFTDDDGKATVVSGYDRDDYYNPIMIELDECGERVRVYQDAPSWMI